MTVALFDLDNTLLNGDSDHAWGLYLADIGAVDAEAHRQTQDYFYAQYQAGKLDITAFLDFQLGVLAAHPATKLRKWRAEFLTEIIQPMIDTGKQDLLDRHRQQGHQLAIVTATNDFITRPIAEQLGVSTLIATQAECHNGRYSGKVYGTPCYQEGKVTRVNEWLEKAGLNLVGSWFYSDSINDLPLLEVCDNPVVVTPDDALRAAARERNWPIID